MGAIINNDDAEALLLDIRAARSAATAPLDDRPGAFLVFPTSVVLPASRGGQLVFPVTTGMEPGRLVHRDGSATVSTTVDGVEVTGTFRWTLGVDEEAAPSGLVAPQAAYRFERRGRPLAPPSWSDQLPRSQELARRDPVALGRQRARLLRCGRLAEYWLLRLSDKVLRQWCRGPLQRAIAARPHVDDDDVVQRGMQAACRLLPLYSSAARPPCSWLGMLHLDARRDMHREISRLDWLPADVAAVVALAQAAGVGLDRDATVTLGQLIEAATEIGRPLPRASARQVRRALEAPLLISLEALDGRQVEPVVGRRDPALEAVHDRPGLAAAEVAGLVSDNPRLLALAYLGDPGALRQVSERVIATLRRPGETEPMTRRRCRDQLGLGRPGPPGDGDGQGVLERALGDAARAAAG